MDRPRVESSFELSISQEFVDSARTSIVVSVSIPYRRLVFFLHGGRYEARYRVYLELKGAHGEMVLGEVWEESVAAGSFRETGSVSLAATSRRTFPVVPGDYRAVVTVEVVDTSRRLVEEQDVRVVGAGAGRLELSTPLFRTQSADSLDVRPGEGLIAVLLCPPPGAAPPVINPGGVYGGFDSWARVVCNLVTPSARTEGPVTITARITNAQGVVARYTRASFEDIGAHAALCFDINYDQLEIGAYRLEIVAETDGGALKSESEGRFVVLFNRGLLGPRAAELADILSLVGGEKDARAVAEAPPDDRIKAWNDFWRKRDPTPSTPANEAFGEFLRRLQYVLETFSRHGPGWRTDMGKVFIENGTPDRIEDRQDASTGRSYELWYYNSKGLVYVFEDIIGTGEYHLITTQMI
jgi:GWxTD domain-containing protein